MARQETHGHAVEEAPAALRSLDPEPVHRRHDPEHAGDPSKRGLGRDLAVDPHLSALGGLGTQVDLVRLGVIGDLRADAPADGIGPPH